MSENLEPVDEVAELRARAVELEGRLREQSAMADARLKQAELKAEALRAGMIDLDGLKLVDTGSVTLGADGALEGGAALMQQLRKAKPWLFADASSSAVAQPPRAEPPRARRATELTVEEWRAARAELLRAR